MAPAANQLPGHHREHNLVVVKACSSDQVSLSLGLGGELEAVDAPDRFLRFDDRPAVLRPIAARQIAALFRLNGSPRVGGIVERLLRGSNASRSSAKSSTAPPSPSETLEKIL
jgi:hypothetical protein